MNALMTTTTMMDRNGCLSYSNPTNSIHFDSGSQSMNFLTAEDLSSLSQQDLMGDCLHFSSPSSSSTSSDGFQNQVCSTASLASSTPSIDHQVQIHDSNLSSHSDGFLNQKDEQEMSLDEPHPSSRLSSLADDQTNPLHRRSSQTDLNLFNPIWFLSTPSQKKLLDPHQAISHHFNSSNPSPTPSGIQSLQLGSSPLTHPHHLLSRAPELVLSDCDGIEKSPSLGCSNLRWSHLSSGSDSGSSNPAALSKLTNENRLKVEEHQWSNERLSAFDQVSHPFKTHHHQTYPSTSSLGSRSSSVQEFDGCAPDAHLSGSSPSGSSYHSSLGSPLRSYLPLKTSDHPLSQASILPSSASQSQTDLSQFLSSHPHRFQDGLSQPILSYGSTLAPQVYPPPHHYDQEERMRYETSMMMMMINHEDHARAHPNPSSSGLMTRKVLQVTKYLCPKCGKGHSRQSNLLAHLRDTHSNQKKGLFFLSLFFFIFVFFVGV